MFDFTFWAIASIPSALLIGTAAYWFMTSEYRRKGYEPVFDYDALQDELDREFAPLSVEQGARFQ